MKLSSLRRIRELKKNFLPFGGERVKLAVKFFVLRFYARFCDEIAKLSSSLFLSNFVAWRPPSFEMPTRFLFRDSTKKKKTFTTTCFCRRLFYLCRFDYIIVLLLSRSPLCWTREFFWSKVLFCLRLSGVEPRSDTFNTQRHGKCNEDDEASSTISSTLKLHPSDILKSCSVYLLFAGNAAQFYVYDSSFKSTSDMNHCSSSRRRSKHCDGAMGLKAEEKLIAMLEARELEKLFYVFFLRRSALLSSSH